FKSERWPLSNRKGGPASDRNGGRHQIGKGGRLASESAPYNRMRRSLHPWAIYASLASPFGCHTSISSKGLGFPSSEMLHSNLMPTAPLVLDPTQLRRIEAVHRGFLHQHLYAAGCLMLAAAADASAVVAEADEDKLLTRAADLELDTLPQ